MPPRGVTSAKRKRQYEDIKRSELARGRSNKVAERIAAATTNKTRREKGETKGSREKRPRAGGSPPERATSVSPGAVLRPARIE